jgi:hypothetical protein
LSKISVWSALEWENRGVSRRHLRTLVDSGGLVRLKYGAYATKAAVDWAEGNSRRQHVLLVYAALGSVGWRGAASHQSAAVIHGLDLLSDPGDLVTLTVPPGRKRSGRRAGRSVLCHASAVPENHRDKLYAIWVTSGPRTVADLARTLPFMDAVVTVDSALRADVAARGEIERVLEYCKGWPGAHRAKRAVEFGDRGSDSVLESCGRVVLHEHGIEAPQLQAAIRGDRFQYSVDMCWERHKTIVEFDGMVKYENDEEGDSLRAQFERDRVLRDAGYQVVHVTWAELFGDPGLVIGRVRKAFASRTAF